MRSLKFIAAALFLGLTTFTTASAAPAAPEGAFVDKLGQQALSILADKSLAKEAAQNKFKEMLNSNFDLSTIGKFVLGRYWKIATPAEQEEYLKLFQKMVEKIYLDRFSLYSGEKFAVGDVRAEGDSDKIVASQVVRPNGPPVNVEWRVRGNGSAMKIVDVIVEGVSMSVTQRAEFASVIQRGGGNVEALLKMMREKSSAPAGTVAATNG